MLEHRGLRVQGLSEASCNHPSEHKLGPCGRQTAERESGDVHQLMQGGAQGVFSDEAGWEEAMNDRLLSMERSRNLRGRGFSLYVEIQVVTMELND